MSSFKTDPQYDRGAGLGITSAASYVGPWIKADCQLFAGIQVNVTGTANPAATWDVDICNDPQADIKPDASLNPPFTTMARTTEMGAAGNFPAGAGVAVNAFFTLSSADTNRPFPRAKFWRFKYTRSAGGAANGLKIAISTQGSY